MVESTGKTKGHFLQLLRTHLKSLLIVMVLLAPINAERVVLVLSGGGARGLSHIGVLRSLEKKNIKPDLIVGTSMGGIVGALYACGLSADEIDSLLHEGNLPQLLTAESDRRYIPMQEKSHRPQSVLSLTLTKGLKFSPIRGLLNGQIIYNLLSPTTLKAQMHAGSSFDSLTIPLRLITTNIETGEVVVHSEGDLLKVIKASSTIPGAFPPVEINGGLHVDGGIKANIPIIEEFLRSDDIIIAVDATSPLATADKLNNPIDIILQITGISMEIKEEESRRNATILIQPDLTGITNTDFDSSRAIITAGEKACNGHSALELLAVETPLISQKEALPTPSFSTLEIIGNTKTKDNYIRRSTAFQPGTPLENDVVQNSVKSLYGSSIFSNIHVSGSHDTLRIQVEEQNRAKLSFGLRVDEYHLAEVFVMPSFYNIFGAGINSDFYFQLGYIRKQLRASLSGNVPFTNLHALHYDLSAYISSERVINRSVIDTLDSVPAVIEYSEFDLSKNGFNLSLGWDINKVVSLIGGARFERYGLRQSNNASTDYQFATKNTQRTFYAGVEADYLDEYYFPQKGGSHQLWFSGSTEKLGAVQNFFTINGHHKFVIPINARNVFLPSLHYSWADQPLPATSKYYLGGGRRQNPFTPSTLFYAIPMAGIREHTLPADMFLLMTLQYRHRFGANSRFFASIYMDWGYGWDSKPGLSIGTALSDFFVNAPLAIEIEGAIKTIVGPIKLSWSKIVVGSYPDVFNIDNDNIFRISVGYNF